MAAQAVRRRLADGDDPVPMQPASAFAGLPGAEDYAIRLRVRFEPTDLPTGRDAGTVLDPQTGARLLELTLVDNVRVWASAARAMRAVRAARLVARTVDIFVSRVGRLNGADELDLAYHIRTMWQQWRNQLAATFPSAAQAQLWPAGPELIIPGLATQTSAGMLQAQAKLALALVLAVRRRVTGEPAAPAPEALLGALFFTDADRAQAAELYHALALSDPTSD